MLKPTLKRRSGFRLSALALAGVTLFSTMGSSHAFQLDTDPDWKVRFDSTVLYNLGMRMKDVNSNIGNDPVFAESDYRFPNKGDTVTNRLSVLAELDAVYQSRMGLRLSASAWKDAAYDNNPRTNPNPMIAFPAGVVAPVAVNVPYPTNYYNGEYSSYTKRYHVEGGELLDAFVFTNFDLNDRPASLKVGKMTQFWGNALFFGGAGISFSQSATDAIKQMTAPGTQAKELAMPRGQINFSTQVTDTLQVGAQYFLQWQADRLPAGGTYLSPATDFLFEGPDQFGALGLPRLESSKPDNINKNFGLQARWSPEWLNGTMGFYYRQFDETTPWNPMLSAMMNPGFNPLSPPSATNPPVVPIGYRLAYPDQTKMLAWSLDKQIGGASVGMEVSYRQNTGLNSATTINPGDLNGTLGARGDTLNIVANALSILDRSPLYNTGTLLGEVAVVHKLRVSEQEALYQGVGTAACNAAAIQAGLTAGSDETGCSTDTAVVIAGMFEPQWLQAFPGWDLSMPMFAMYGLHGTAVSNGLPVKKGDVMYGIGVKAVLNSRYNFALQYNGYDGPSTGMTTVGGSPFGAAHYASGNNNYRLSDRNWLSFTFSTTF